MPAAHIRRLTDGQFVVHPLEDHLTAVADLAGQFAVALNAGAWGHKR